MQLRVVVASVVASASCGLMIRSRSVKRRAPTYAGWRTDFGHGVGNNEGPINHDKRRCAMNSVFVFWSTYILVLTAGLGLLGVSWS